MFDIKRYHNIGNTLNPTTRTPPPRLLSPHNPYSSPNMTLTLGLAWDTETCNNITAISTFLNYQTWYLPPRLKGRWNINHCSHLCSTIQVKYIFCEHGRSQERYYGQFFAPKFLTPTDIISTFLLLYAKFEDNTCFFCGYSTWFGQIYKETSVVDFSLVSKSFLPYISQYSTP